MDIYAKTYSFTFFAKLSVIDVNHVKRKITVR